MRCPVSYLVLWVGQIALISQTNEVAAFASVLGNWINQNCSTKSDSVRNSVAAQVVLSRDSIVEVYGMWHYDPSIIDTPNTAQVILLNDTIWCRTL